MHTKLTYAVVAPNVRSATAAALKCTIFNGSRDDLFRYCCGKNMDALLELRERRTLPDDWPWTDLHDVLFFVLVEFKGAKIRIRLVQKDSRYLPRDFTNQNHGRSCSLEGER